MFGDKEYNKMLKDIYSDNKTEYISSHEYSKYLHDYYVYDLDPALTPFRRYSEYATVNPVLIVLKSVPGGCPYCSRALDVKDRWHPDRGVVSFTWSCVPCDKHVTQQISEYVLSYLKRRPYEDATRTMLETLFSDVREAFLDDEPEFEGWAVGLDD